MPRTRNARRQRTVATLRHEEDTRTNIPTAEYQYINRTRQSLSGKPQLARI